MSLLVKIKLFDWLQNLTQVAPNWLQLSPIGESVGKNSKNSTGNPVSMDVKLISYLPFNQSYHSTMVVYMLKDLICQL